MPPWKCYPVTLLHGNLPSCRYRSGQTQLWRASHSLKDMEGQKAEWSLLPEGPWWPTHWQSCWVYRQRETRPQAESSVVNSGRICRQNSSQTPWHQRHDQENAGKRPVCRSAIPKESTAKSLWRQCIRPFLSWLSLQHTQPEAKQTCAVLMLTHQATNAIQAGGAGLSSRNSPDSEIWRVRVNPRSLWVGTLLSMKPPNLFSLLGTRQRLGVSLAREENGKQSWWRGEKEIPGLGNGVSELSACFWLVGQRSFSMQKLWCFLSGHPGTSPCLTFIWVPYCPSPLTLPHWWAPFRASPSDYCFWGHSPMTPIAQRSFFEELREGQFKWLLLQAVTQEKLQAIVSPIHLCLRAVYLRV